MCLHCLNSTAIQASEIEDESSMLVDKKSIDLTNSSVLLILTWSMSELEIIGAAVVGIEFIRCSSSMMKKRQAVHYIVAGRTHQSSLALPGLWCNPVIRIVFHSFITDWAYEAIL